MIDVLFDPRDYMYSHKIYVKYILICISFPCLTPAGFTNTLSVLCCERNCCGVAELNRPCSCCPVITPPPFHGDGWLAAGWALLSLLLIQWHFHDSTLPWRWQFKPFSLWFTASPSPFKSSQLSSKHQVVWVALLGLQPESSELAGLLCMARSAWPRPSKVQSQQYFSHILLKNLLKTDFSSWT